METSCEIFSMSISLGISAASLENSAFGSTLHSVKMPMHIIPTVRYSGLGIFLASGGSNFVFSRHCFSIDLSIFDESVKTIKTFTKPLTVCITGLACLFS